MAVKLCSMLFRNNVEVLGIWRFSIMKHGSREASTMTKILDGSVWQLESRKGSLMGEDSLGNKYYENNNYQQGRNRWVVMKDLNDYSAANVPREWHGWLHHINDEPGLKGERDPIYEDKSPKFVQGKSTSGVYYPKGHWLHQKGVRDWKRYAAWE
jgi:NADH dehydrogenase (ubiquinone) 1 alpha subcomplex subunit 12